MSRESSSPSGVRVGLDIVGCVYALYAEGSLRRKRLFVFEKY